MRTAWVGFFLFLAGRGEERRGPHAQSIDRAVCGESVGRVLAASRADVGVPVEGLSLGHLLGMRHKTYILPVFPLARHRTEPALAASGYRPGQPPVGFRPAAD